MISYAGAWNIGTETDRQQAISHLKGLRRKGAIHGSDGWHCDVIARTNAVLVRSILMDCPGASKVATTVCYSAATQVSLLWDGRLDNEDELKRKLDTSFTEEPGPSTCETLILAAYLKWGTRFIDHLVGDFSLAICDFMNHQIILARDPFGLRPLYYSTKGGELWWSTEIGVLTNLPDAQATLNDDFVAGYLTYTEDTTSTPYLAVHSVEPGSLLIFSGDHLSATVSRYWGLATTKTLSYRSDADYEEHFRYLFELSLRRRIGNRTRVVCELSGGLDSSSIVCSLDRMLHGGETSLKSITTASFIYDRSGGSDEQSFIESVIRKTGAPNHLIEDHQILSCLDYYPDNYVPNPHRAFRCTYEKLARLMYDAGTDLLLSGTCGDHVFMHDPTFYPILSDFLLRAEWKMLYIYSKDLARYRTKSVWSTFWLGALWPLLPLRVRTNVQPNKMKLPSWFDDDFARKTSCRERILLRAEADCSHLPPCARQRRSLLRNAISTSSMTRYREQFGIDVAMPYLDRDLVEFLMNIPAEQLLRPNQDRSLQRRAFSNILPPDIASRTDKKGPSEPVLRAIKRNGEELEALCKRSFLARRSIIKQHELMSSLAKARHGFEHQSADLFRILTLEQWASNREAAGMALS
ncbi:MAG: asparagine synthase-related protein [Acidobacteriota bacterium]|nr:asparagine synthase-related protein [Acidobacteriota bacterium]